MASFLSKLETKARAMDEFEGKAGSKAFDMKYNRNRKKRRNNNKFIDGEAKKTLPKRLKRELIASNRELTMEASVLDKEILSSRPGESDVRKNAIRTLNSYTKDNFSRRSLRNRRNRRLDTSIGYSFSSDDSGDEKDEEGDEGIEEDDVEEDTLSVRYDHQVCNEDIFSLRGNQGDEEGVSSDNQSSCSFIAHDDSNSDDDDDDEEEEEQKDYVEKNKKRKVIVLSDSSSSSVSSSHSNSKANGTVAQQLQRPDHTMMFHTFGSSNCFHPGGYIQYQGGYIHPGGYTQQLGYTHQAGSFHQYPQQQLPPWFYHTPPSHFPGNMQLPGNIQYPGPISTSANQQQSSAYISHVGESNYDRIWKDNFSSLHQKLQINGGSISRDDIGFTLYSWLSEQRRQRTQQTLASWREKMLNTLGVSW